MSKSKWFLVAGDALVIGLVTVTGFATHGEGNLSFLPRGLAVFIPLTIAWFLLAPWFGLFQQDITSNLKRLWRIVYVMVFAAPLAVIVRGLILNASIAPIFAVVLGGTSAFGVFIWRGVFILFNRK